MIKLPAVFDWHSGYADQPGLTLFGWLLAFLFGVSIIVSVIAAAFFLAR